MSNRLESDDAGGEPMDEPVQCHCLTFGCCGQNFSEEYVNGGSGKDVMPSTIYGHYAWFPTVVRVVTISTRLTSFQRF
jgi:hypothetical protein